MQKGYDDNRNSVTVIVKDATITINGKPLYIIIANEYAPSPDDTRPPMPMASVRAVTCTLRPMKNARSNSKK